MRRTEPGERTIRVSVADDLEEKQIVYIVGKDDPPESVAAIVATAIARSLRENTPASPDYKRGHFAGYQQAIKDNL